MCIGKQTYNRNIVHKNFIKVKRKAKIFNPWSNTCKRPVC